MSKLVTAMLVRNEADKYLERVLTRCWDFSDQILVLDDGSTDGSDRIAWRLGCQVRQRRNPGMWGNESPARAELWSWLAEEAGDGWALVCDADMLLHGDPRPLTLSTQCNSWSWILYDLWDDERYFRHDGHWKGHLFPRPWMFRPSKLQCDPPIWPDRGLHVGHCPLNAQLNVGVAQDLAWCHLAYVKRSSRLLKRDRYLAEASQLSPWELDHARSVGD